MSQRKGSKGPSERAKKAEPDTPKIRRHREVQRLLLNPEKRC